MRTVSITAAQAGLSELVVGVMGGDEHVVITRNGSPAAVIVSVDLWESIQETLFWQSQPNLSADLAEAHREYAAGQTVSVDEIRLRYGPANR